MNRPTRPHIDRTPPWTASGNESRVIERSPIWSMPSAVGRWRDKELPPGGSPKKLDAVDPMV